MMPIVNGLEAEFGDKVKFLYFNATDGAEGQYIFEALSLPGHPSYVIFTSSAEELYRSFGIVSENSLQTAVENALHNLMSETDIP
jgi:hypothetical protein